MIDKQIIDGVDVSECEFYCEKYCNLSNDRNEQLPFAAICSEYSNCYYKQLKRKEQECEQKERDIKHLKKCLDDSFKIQEDNELYWKKENKTLKQALDRIKQIKKDFCVICKQQYYNQHCEECDTGLILDIINKADCRQSAECFCEAKHADTFNADKQAVKEQ